MRGISFANRSPEQPVRSSIDLRAEFGKRLAIETSEAADVLGCCDQQIVNLIQEFHDTGGQSGLEGFSVSIERAAKRRGAGPKNTRAAWRVPVVGLQKFLDARTQGLRTAPRNHAPPAKSRRSRRRTS
jgi:hypothetical protein